MACKRYSQRLTYAPANPAAAHEAGCSYRGIPFVKALALLSRLRPPVRPIVYEVRLEIDPAVISDFDDWLLVHAREMLAFPGFQSATVHRGTDVAENGRALRLAVYAVRSQRDLDSYLHTHAARMRNEGVARFGTQFAASRRVLPADGYALPEGFAPLHDANAISGGLPVCSNCHQPVPGRFCANCGQEDRTFLLSLGELAYDFIGDLFNFDSRFFRTLRPLVARPGWLTIEYVRGRRQHYLPPVRMYIFISLIFFFVVALIADGQFGTGFKTAAPDEAGSGAAARNGLDDLTPEERAEAERGIREAEKALGLPAGSLPVIPPAQEEAPTDAPAGEDDAPADASSAAAGTDPEPSGPTVSIEDGNLSVAGLGSETLEDRLERGALTVKRNPQAFAQAVLQQIPSALFVFLPLIALVLKLLYIGTGRYYVEHLIFTLHYHSAVFVLLLLWLLFGELQAAWRALDPLSGWIAAALWLYLPYYLYRSLRAVYGQGRFVTVVKFTLLLFAYSIAVVALFVLTLLYTLYLQA